MCHNASKRGNANEKDSIFPTARVNHENGCGHRTSVRDGFLHRLRTLFSILMQSHLSSEEVAVWGLDV